MAVAARPGASDARVPCPLCGGLIHPIAGKCKHCKADLTSYHAARPAASAPLPALHQALRGNGHGGGYAPADAAQGPVAHAVAAPAAAMYEPSQAVLPPRPTSPAYPAEPRGSRWRSWPVVVIVLAMVAIVVAVVLMVWPASRRDLDGKHTTGSPPAPQRMQTAPEIAIPPLSPNAHPRVAPPTPDPWSPRQHDPAAAAPSPQSVDPATGDDVDDPGADTLDDLGGSQSPPPPAAAQDRRRPRANGSGLMYLAMVEHMCLKIHQCGADSAAVGAMCDKLSHHEPPANCPAAERCLEQIDTISCGAQSGDLVQLQEMMTQLSDCADAVRC